MPHTGSTGAKYEADDFPLFKCRKDCHVAEQLTGANRFCRLAVSEIHDFTGKEDEVGRVLANEEGERTIEHKSDLFAKCRAGR